VHHGEESGRARLSIENDDAGDSDSDRTDSYAKEHVVNLFDPGIDVRPGDTCGLSHRLKKQGNHLVVQGGSRRGIVHFHHFNPFSSHDIEGVDIQRLRPT
jgi:hypothetical protein